MPKRGKIETIQLHNRIIELRKKGYTHQMIMEELNLKEKNYLKHYSKITQAFVNEYKSKNEYDAAEAIKLAETRLNDIYNKAVEQPLQDDKASYFVKIKAGELGMNVLTNMLKIQYDGNKLFQVFTKGLASTSDLNPNKALDSTK